MIIAPVDPQHRNTKPQFTLFLLIDSSLAMGQEGIEAVNCAMPKLVDWIKETLSERKKQNLDEINVLISVLEISDTISWMYQSRKIVNDFNWIDLEIRQPYQTTRLGAAFDELNFRLSKRQLLKNDAEFPIILLFSASPSSDNYKPMLYELKSNPWFSNAIRIAVPIKMNNQLEVLSEFAGDSSLVCSRDFIGNFEMVLENHFHHLYMRYDEDLMLNLNELP